MQRKKLLLVDYENKHHLDLSILDSSYKAIIFVGHHQPESKLRKKIDSKNQFVRVDYQKIDGHGKNALDFHIAFTLGRTFESDSNVSCYVLSSDKGFDPLIKHLDSQNFSCVRVESISEIADSNHIESNKKINEIKSELSTNNSELNLCKICKKNSTIEHNGGRWCSNCGRFSSMPYLEVMTKYIESPTTKAHYSPKSNLFCCICSQNMDTSDGVYNDGEWTCWPCLGV